MEDTPAGRPDAPLSTPDAIRSRRNTRHFRPDPIPPEVLRELVDLTVAAPSSWNFQPWRIVLVTDAEQRERLSAACWNQAQPKEAPATFVFAISHRGWAHNMEEVIEIASGLGAWPEPYVEFFRNVAVKSQEGLGDGLREYNTKDALIAATHLALAAESFGLASAYMNGYAEDAVKEVIGAAGDDDIGISLVMPIGYASERGGNPGRLPTSRTVFDGALDRPWSAA